MANEPEKIATDAKSELTKVLDEAKAESNRIFSQIRSDIKQLEVKLNSKLAIIVGIVAFIAGQALAFFLRV